MRSDAVVWAFVATLAVGLTPAVAAIQSEPAAAAIADARLLDIPFVPQSERLCGGAAAAMVLRYWKPAPVYAEDFAPFVDEAAGGIRLGDLARAVRDRGWHAVPVATTSADVERHVAGGRPVIALIEDSPGRNHYVVVVGWTATQVVFHDPARGPSRILDVPQFERRWAVTGRSALLITPDGAATDARAGELIVPVAVENSCQTALDTAVGVARDGDLAAAEPLLSSVAKACPAFSGGPRELAGIRFLQKRWTDAVSLAEEAVSRDPSDMHAWQLLASTRFLSGDPHGALAAWNQRGEPRVDLARIDGLDRTPYDVVAGALNLAPRTLLTEAELRRATRRVAALPVVGASRVSYAPAANGLATVDVAIVERPLVPDTWTWWAATAAHAATAREARITLVSPSRNGERWTMSGRWWDIRPRVALSLEVPRLSSGLGVWRVDGFWERQAYQLVAGAELSTRSTDGTSGLSDRRHAALTVGDWATGDVRWEVGAAVDHWNNRGNQIALRAALEQRFIEDRLALRGEAVAWRRFATAEIRSMWRASTEPWSLWRADGGLAFATSNAPLDVWPAADTGHVRTPLLRAHPLLLDGAIRADRIGRVLAHGTFEMQRRVKSLAVAQLGVAAFVDVAKLAKPLNRLQSPAQVDFGAGLRARLPGAPGFLRIDIARGIRDRQMALSAAWQLQP